MSRIENVRFEPCGFVCLRSPLLSFDVLTKWSEGLNTSLGSLDDRALFENRQLLITRLQDIATDPRVQEAIAVASSSLSQALESWLVGDGLSARVTQAIARYVQRMASRSTPFGLFASVSIAPVGDNTVLVLGDAPRRFCRLDHGCLHSVWELLANKPDIRRQLVFRPNDSLYRTGGRWRYVETRLVAHLVKHLLVAAEATEELDFVIAVAAKGLSIPDLVDALVERYERDHLSEDEASSYVNALVDSQLLVSTIGPALTGQDALTRLIAEISPVASPTVLSCLVRVQCALDKLNASGLGDETINYTVVRESLQDLGIEPPPECVQVDVIRNADTTSVSFASVSKIAAGAQLLHRIFGPATDGLDAFRDAFTRRYGTREVPLLEALDAENGVTTDSETSAFRDPSAAELLDGYPMSEERSPFSSSHRDTVLLAKLQHIQSRQQELVLSEADVEAMRSRSAALPLPRALSVVASFFKESPTGDQQIFLRGVSGPGAAALLGRFCHADTALLAAVKGAIAAEESLEPTSSCAEVVHLPSGRHGNVSFRPLLRQYEISYLGRSGAPEHLQIPASDLTVSVEGSHIVLRSVRLNRVITPRLSNALKFTRGEPVYRFLGLLQGQGTTRNIEWSWGSLESLDFLPRVRYGNLVLSRARWRLSARSISAFVDADSASRYRVVQAWRRESAAPRWVALVQGDNELTIDLDNILSVEAFTSLLKTGRSSVLVEVFSPPALSCIGPEGTHAHEMIIPFVARSQPATQPVITHHRRADVTRVFPPGSSWLYAKWYGGQTDLDRVLSEAVTAIVANVSPVINRWHFIRYSEPSWHLRLRFNAPPDVLWSDVWRAVTDAGTAAFASGRIYKIEMDTYERECERYGGEHGISLSEDVFWRDSVAALESVSLMRSSEETAGQRWQVCMIGWDRFLDDLGLDLERKGALLALCHDNLRDRFRASKAHQLFLDRKYRALRPTVDRLLSGDETRGRVPQEMARIFAKRSHDLASTFAELKRVSDVSCENLALSFLHMHANRVLISSHNLQELAISGLLARAYRSQLARARNGWT
jgi:lantibiotic biosynthesis protein